MDSQEHELGSEQNPLPYNNTLRFMYPNDKGIAWSPDTGKYHRIHLPPNFELRVFTVEQENRIREIIHEEIRNSIGDV